jgi:hypothetical protein
LPRAASVHEPGFDPVDTRLLERALSEGVTMRPFESAQIRPPAAYLRAAARWVASPVVVHVQWLFGERIPADGPTARASHVSPLKRARRAARLRFAGPAGDYNQRSAAYAGMDSGELVAARTLTPQPYRQHRHPSPPPVRLEESVEVSDFADARRLRRT